MKANKKLTEKALLFQRLKDRWSRLPSNITFDVVMNYEVNEQALNNSRADRLNNYIKEAKIEHDRKKNSNG